MSKRQASPNRLGLKGADRVLAVLLELSEHPRGIDLAQLAQLMEEPKSNIHRALSALCRAGLAQRTHRGAYRLGFEALRLAFSYYEALDERELVAPLLEALAVRTGEVAHYAVLDSPDVVYIAKVEAPGRHTQMSSVVGGRNPAHCTGVGKALLAYHLTTREQVATFVSRHGPLAQRTPNSITDPEQLHEELANTRARGYSVDAEENERGIVCLGLPVFIGHSHLPRAAVSITALAARTPLNDLLNVRPSVQELIKRFELTGTVDQTA